MKSRAELLQDLVDARSDCEDLERELKDLRKVDELAAALVSELRCTGFTVAAFRIMNQLNGLVKHDHDCG